MHILENKSSVNLHTVWIMHTTVLLVRVAFMYLQTFTLHSDQHRHSQLFATTSAMLYA